LRICDFELRIEQEKKQAEPRGGASSPQAAIRN